MLATSIFSFSHKVFYPFQSKFQFFSHILLSANAFNLGQSKVLWLGKGLIDLLYFECKASMVENPKSAFWFHDGEITRFTEVMHAKVHTFIIMNELLVHYKVCHALAKGT